MRWGSAMRTHAPRARAVTPIQAKSLLRSARSRTSPNPVAQRTLNLQRSIGNQALLRALRSRVSRGVSSPGAEASGGCRGADAAVLQHDKSVRLVREKQDQNASLKSLAAHATGIEIAVDQVGTYSSPDYPDGFRWTQTVTTNDPGYTPVGAPLLSTPITYVDPMPNDDSKPFYWTDSEFASHGTRFEDHPARPPHASGPITWDAVLSLNGVDGKAVDRFDTLSYGFTISSIGVVTTRGPSSPASIAGHLSALRAAFPDWQFQDPLP